MGKPFFLYTFLPLYCLLIGLHILYFSNWKDMTNMHMLMTKILFFLLENVLDRLQFNDGIQRVCTGLRERVLMNVITFSERVLNLT